MTLSKHHVILLTTSILRWSNSCCQIFGTVAFLSPKTTTPRRIISTSTTASTSSVPHFHLDGVLKNPTRKKNNVVVLKARGGGHQYDGPPIRVSKCFPNLSRRQAEQTVKEGRVQVDGSVVNPGYRLIGGQRLTVDNQNIDWESKAIALLHSDEKGQTKHIPKKKKKSSAESNNPFVYYKYHKPVGVTCTMDKHDKRGLVYSLPPKIRKTHGDIFPVGRLDLDSEGLVLVTNDGQLAEHMLQPKYEHEKEYVVEIQPRLSEEQIQDLSDGVVITTLQQRGGKSTTKPTKPCVVEEVVSRTKPNIQTLRFVLCEGRNRQIRKMVESVGSKVVKLQRVRQNVLKLGKLPSRNIVPLLDTELEQLLLSLTSTFNYANHRSHASNNGEGGGSGRQQRNSYRRSNNNPISRNVNPSDSRRRRSSPN